MRIEDGYHDVPAGRIASVVTYLEMRRAPAPLDAALAPGLTVRRMEMPETNWYRELFRAVGERWLWFSRSILSDRELEKIIHHPMVEIYALQQGGKAKGLLELDCRGFPDIELSFFGLTEDLIGRGVGRYLIQHGIRQAFRHSPRRFFLHTCTLDHPAALSFYRKAGFQPYKQVIEVAPDPRLHGNAARDSAPQTPIIGA